MEDIKKFMCCPKCGSDLGYYQKTRYKGAANDNRLFGTNEPYNHHNWDGCKETWRSKGYYCMECDKMIFKYKKNKSHSNG